MKLQAPVQEAREPRMNGKVEEKCVCMYVHVCMHMCEREVEV
jgi:hypothetical protein